jgi:hypothetical protein
MRDRSDAPPSRNSDPIPAGTTVTVNMHVDADGVDEDGQERLHAELIVVSDGPHKGRKFSWGRPTLAR